MSRVIPSKAVREVRESGSDLPHTVNLAGRDCVKYTLGSNPVEAHRRIGGNPIPGDHLLAQRFLAARLVTGEGDGDHVVVLVVADEIDDA